MSLFARTALGSLVLALFAGGPLAASDSVAVWMTLEDRSRLLSREADLGLATRPADPPPREAIQVHPDQTGQSLLGLGASFDHASCYNLSRLSPENRRDVLRRLFDREQGIGINLMRICIGTSDFVGESFYTYNDLPDGMTDPEIERFSIERDRVYVIPAIRAAQAVNPELRLFASPWSPPAWMKTNRSLKAGSLDPQWYPAYARYLVKFLKAYAAEGIPILALTLQNEPDFPNPNYPTCRWTGEQQRDFIRDHLGPLLRREGLKTEIWCWDHNWNNLDFARTILRDPAAAAHVQGVAFHHYEGTVTAQRELHREFPDVAVYFTEGSTFGVRGARQIADILRNDSRSYNYWVFLLDEHQKPNNGPHSASPTALERLDNGTVRANFDYFMYGQFMRFLRRDARRVESSGGTRRLGHVAFRNPDGQTVLVVVNESNAAQPLEVRCGDRAFNALIPGRAVATYLW